MSVVIIGGEPAIASGLAERLVEQGHPVLTLTDGSASTSPGSPKRCDITSADALVAELEQAAATFGETPALLRIGVRAIQATRGELAAIGLDDWVARGEQPLLEAFAFHQAAQRFLADRGGRVISVLPTVGLSGGRGYVPLATTAEADRSLVKAQARVAGANGVTINCIAVASALLTGSGEDPADDPDRGGLPAYALARADLAAVADVVAAMLGPAFATVTGQTIAVDGGRWMAS